MTTEVAPGIFACEQPDGPRRIRQVVFAGDRQALVVDAGLPGAPASGILPLLARLGVPAVLLLTHPDADHLAGTAEILAAHPGCEVFAGPADLPLMGDPERAIRERYARFAAVDDVPFTREMAERARSRFGPAFPQPAPAPDGLQVDLGGRVVEFIATPGHSPGHTAVWCAADGVLAAADAAMGRAIRDCDGHGYIPPMYAPPAVYVATVTRLAALAPRLLLTGHEPVMDGDAAQVFLADSVAANERLAALTAAAVEVGPATLAVLCERVCAAYGDLPAERARDLALTVDGHLADLAAAGDVTVEQGPPRTFRSSA